MADASTPQNMSPKLQKVAEIAQRDPNGRLFALAHLMDEDELVRAYRRLRNNAAVGVDGVTKEAYGQNLGGNIQDLLTRLKAKQYRHQPIRRVHIPKAKGRTRPIGLSTTEDKIVQGAMREVLQAIYEQDFLDCSYGFRPKRSAHDAMRAIHQAAYRGEVQWVLEADVQSFFGAPGQAWHFQRVQFPPRQGAEPLHRESSLGLMEVTTWVKRRQSDARAVTQVKQLSSVRTIRRPTGSKIWKAKVSSRYGDGCWRLRRGLRARHERTWKCRGTWEIPRGLGE